MAGSTNIPLTTLTASHGPYTFGPMNIAAQDTNMMLAIDRTVPGGLNSLDGNASIEIKCEQSNDNGQSWFLAVAGDTPGGIYVNGPPRGDGSVIGQSDVRVTLYPGQKNRMLVRAIVTVTGPDVAVAGQLIIDNTPIAPPPPVPETFAVSFDAVGPSSTAAVSSAATTLSWSHTSGAGGNTLLAGAALDPSGSDAGMSMTCTYGGAGMTQLGTAIHSNGQTAGFLDVWQTTAATGTATIQVTAAGGTPAHLTAGSMSFTGAGAFGTPVTFAPSGTTNVTSIAITVPTTTSGNIIAMFGISGHDFNSTTTPAVQREHTANTNSSTNAGGFTIGVTNASTGSSVTTTNGISGADWAGAFAVEVQAGGGGPVAKAQKVRTVYGNPAHLVGTGQNNQLMSAAYR